MSNKYLSKVGVFIRDKIGWKTGAAFIVGFILGMFAGAQTAEAATTYTPQAWRLYRSGVAQPGSYVSAAACDAALRTLPVNVGQTVTFRCQQSTVARGVADPPVDCVVSEWGPWIPGLWSACANGQQSREETRERSVLVAPANGGAACPTLDEDRVVTQGCTVTPPPTTALIADDFEYVLVRNATRATKEAVFGAAGWGVKDEATQPGAARGYLYTADVMPNCGRPPDGSRFLVVEGLATTLGGQTDYYLQWPRTIAPVNGALPARVKISGETCVESGNIQGQHNKIFYTAYGTRPAGWPMSADEQASLIVQTNFYYVGTAQVPAPCAGCYTFTDLTSGKATVAAQVASGNGSKLSANMGVDPWLRPGQWTEFEVLIDVSGAQGSYEVRLKRGANWVTVTRWVGGEPGINWPTTAIDREGGKGVRIPTTQGPGSGAPGPDNTQLFNRLSISRGD